MPLSIEAVCFRNVGLTDRLLNQPGGCVEEVLLFILFSAVLDAKDRTSCMLGRFPLTESQDNPGSPPCPGYSVNSQNRIHETEGRRNSYLERVQAVGRREKGGAV